MTENLISITRIRQHYNMLSKSKRKIADYVMENYERVINYTALELAEETGTSPSTIVLFSRSLGFKGFTDFRENLEKELAKPTTKWTNFGNEESVHVIKNRTLEFNKASLEEAVSLVDDESLEEAAKVINNAPMVAIIAEGGSASSARSAYDALMQIGINCTLVTDPFFQILSISSLPDDAVVISVCHSGQARNVVEATMLAKKREMTTIGLVGIVGSPLTKYSDIILLTGITEHPFFSDSITARLCELNIISVLLSMLSLNRDEKSDDMRKNVSDLLEIKRIIK